MESMEKVYQMSGYPFVVRDIDRLFYACCYINSNQSFLMEKEKFDMAVNRGRIIEHQGAISI